MSVRHSLVVVPYETLKFAGNKVTLPGGTKEGLKMLPEFQYATGWSPPELRRVSRSRGRTMSDGGR
jgi:hypothetical protein